MSKLNHLMRSLWLACSVALFAPAPLALAGPSYQISIDTSAWAGSSGFIDFNFESNVGAVPAEALLSNASGAFGAEFDRFGSVTGDLAGTVLLTNAPGPNYLTQAADFGGVFSFVLAFGGQFDSTPGSDGALFGISLFNDALTETLGADGAILAFALTPAFNGDAASVLVSVNAPLAAAVPVPEPSQAALLLAGLALLWHARRKSASR